MTSVAGTRQRLARGVGRHVRPWLARLRGNEGTWRRGLDGELDHWRRYFATEGDEWPEEYQARLDPSTPLQPELAALIRPANGAAADGAAIRVLDVGAGPLTILGKTWAGHDVHVTAVDALADRYDELLAEHALDPPVRTQLCHSERLVERFGADTFDLVHARNTLDHGYDPVRAIEQMALVAAPGGVIVLDHHRDVAQYEAYEGLHQWNLRIEGSTYVAWRPGEHRDVMATLGDGYRIDAAEPRPDGWEFVAIRKRPAPG